MDNLFLGKVVESTIAADLERFREYIDNVQREQQEAIATPPDHSK
jgi:uncharacterized membrane protein